MLVSDALAYALRIAGILGVGQVALAQDTADAQMAFNLMVAQWQRKRWLVFRLEDLATTVIPGKPTYTIGPGDGSGTDTDWFYPIRPGSIETAYLRQLTGLSQNSFPVDYPLRIIRSREEWSAISLKGLNSWPGAVFYDATLYVGTLYLWPIPNQSFFELHVVIAPDIINATLDMELQAFMPLEAEEAIVYNLAKRLRMNYQLPPNPGVDVHADTTLRTLRSNNFAMRPLQMPAALRRAPRMKNPMGGFYPETSAGIGYTVLR